MFRSLFLGRTLYAAATVVTALCLCLFAAPTWAQSAPKPESHVRKGKTDGIWYWTLPNTPNGLRPVYSWSGAGSTPNGEIFVAGMDHVQNSALYRLRDGVLRYVGDARSASEAVNNWKAGEVAEKFHTRPTWLDGRVYVATLNSSTLDTDYLTKRGFHWYGYNLRHRRFLDLSIRQPGGVGAEHGGLVTIAADPYRRLIYGAMNPTGDIYLYRIGSGQNKRLGRPDYQRPYVYPGRFTWVDRRGRLYFTAGNDGAAYYGAPYDPAVFNHVRYYDPEKGFGEMQGWTLHNQHAIDAGQCFRNEGVCYLTDDVGHIYEFNEAGPTWRYLGNIGQDNPNKFGRTWVFHVSRDRRKAYTVTASGKGLFYEFDVVTGNATFLADMKKIEPELAAKHSFYGHDAWDRKGRFFFTAFDFQKSPNDVLSNVLLVAIDPKRFSAALRKGAADQKSAGYRSPLIEAD